MDQQKKSIVIMTLLLVLLFFRDVPYLNIFFVNKVWIFYLLVILYLLPLKNIKFAYWGIGISFFGSLLFILGSFSIGAEILGVVIYLLFWVVTVYKLYIFFRSK